MRISDGKDPGDGYMASCMEEPILRLRNVSKSFPGVKALDDVSLDVEKGKVHALAGENGAGKSTLVKVLMGMETPAAGVIVFKGSPVDIRTPHQALRMGISMIHQELLPFPDLTVAENVCMGLEPTRWFPGWLDKPAMNRRTRQLLERLGVSLSPTARMRTLTVPEMQTVEIAKALAYGAEVIIMDEPTSAISGQETAALFAVIRDLKARGVALIYISHKMDEVFAIADTVTVLRDGRRVTTADIRELDENRLISFMVGRELKVRRRDSAGSTRGDQPALEVRGLTKEGKFRDVNLAVHPGEILGIAGLMGAGRTDLAMALFGLAPADSGRILVNGRSVRITRPQDAIANGIAMVSEDRKAYGIVPSMGVKQNITLASLRRCSRGHVIDAREENKVADEQIRTFSIKTRGREQQARFLSGGNQQKVVIAKALLTGPSILILDEPTRGIDIAAKAEIHALIEHFARDGKAVILISSELPDIFALSDRILVMRQGTISAELRPGTNTQEEVLKYAMPD